MRTAASVLDKTGFYLLAAIIVLCPIPFGSNTAAIAGFFGFLISICLLGIPFVPSPARKARDLIRAALTLSALLIAWSVLQVVAWQPPSSLQTISANGQQAAWQPSAFHLQPLHSVGYVLIPLAAFISALAYVRDSTRYLRLLHIALTAGAVVTVLCILEYYLSPQTLLLGQKLHYLESFTGTFVNPNTAATYFGILLLLSLSLCLRQFDIIQIFRANIRTASEVAEVRTFVAYSILTIVFALAVLITRSRGGTLTTLSGVILLTWAFGFSALRPHVSPMRIITYGALSAAVTVALFLFYGGLLLERLQIEGFDDGGRICTYRATWHAIKDNLWLGTGLGSFQDVFPAYRLPECGLNGYWEMAHSVFLEAWLSLGVSFFVCLLVIYYLLIRSYVHGLQARRRSRFVPLVSLSILLLLTLHSLIDFSLQVPAVAIVAAIALGAGAAISLASPRTAQ